RSRPGARHRLAARGGPTVRRGRPPTRHRSPAVLGLLPAIGVPSALARCHVGHLDQLSFA
ncbi:hypothetical protein, partial [Streptomyces triticisoli]|uniref:hypothetical protein n=1 Tax=Streptomyces triticisoli TaxID=2182797 RepID=UPI003F69B931